MVLGASFDPVEENRAFAEAEAFPFRLLADTDHSVGRLYEVVRTPDEEYAEYAKRIAYLIDPEGTIRRAYEVTDVEGFAGQVIEDLDALLHEAS